MAGIAEGAERRNVVHRLYDACMTWISGPFGIWALFFIGVAESSFFPIPPDVFLIAMCISAPARSFRYALVCAAGSVVGGAVGYGLGFWFMDSVGMPIVSWYGLNDKYEVVRHYFMEYDVWIVATAGLTPIPYKLFTITAGFVHSNFLTFMLVSLVSRSARFFLVAGLVWKFGPRIKLFIDRYFNLLSFVFIALLIGGFVLIKFIL